MIDQHQVADPHRGDQAPEQLRLLGHHLRARHDAVDRHGADHQRHHGVGRDAEREQRNERGLRGGVVGAFRCRNALDRAAPEALGVLRDLLLEGVGRERRDHGAAAGQDAEERAKQGTARDRAGRVFEVLHRRHQAGDFRLDDVAARHLFEVAHDLGDSRTRPSRPLRSRYRRQAPGCRMTGATGRSRCRSRRTRAAGRASPSQSP